MKNVTKISKKNLPLNILQGGAGGKSQDWRTGGNPAPAGEHKENLQVRLFVLFVQEVMSIVV